MNRHERSLGVPQLSISRIWIIVILTVLASVLFSQTECAASPAFTLTADTPHLTIDRIEYLIEENPLNNEEAASEAYAGQWIPFDGTRLYLGNFHSPVWLRFDLVDESGQVRLMEVSRQLLDHIQVYLYNQNTARWSTGQVSGNLLPHSSRPISHRNNLFPISLSAGERVSVYLRVASQLHFNVTIDVWQNRAYWLNDLKRILLLGTFFGILVVMSLYNCSLYIFTRDNNYLCYVGYILAVILYELASTGIGGAYLWPDSMWLKQVSYKLFAALSFLTGTIFIRYFLSLKRYGGWLLQLNNGFYALWVLSSIACLFPMQPTEVSLIEFLATITPAAGMVTSIYLWIKGNIQAKYYTIAYLCLNIGTTFLMLGYTGIIERSWLTEYSQMIGFVVEFSLLSIALADRINRERIGREMAQQHALDLSEKVSKAREEKLMIQEQILEVQRQANENLEIRVLERTNELERAINNLELANRELSKLSYTDPLTKTYNRQYYEEILGNEIKRASRTGQPLSVAIADIDHFKQINDTHGHLIGDECLRQVAKTLKRQLGRATDLIARTGGEEFAIVLPSTEQDNALIVAERARDSVESINFIHRGERIQLNVSIGVAGWIPEPYEPNERLIEAAELALRKAKSNGRNMAVAAKL